MIGEAPTIKNHVDGLKNGILTCSKLLTSVNAILDAIRQFNSSAIILQAKDDQTVCAATQPAVITPTNHSTNPAAPASFITPTNQQCTTLVDHVAAMTAVMITPSNQTRNWFFP